jgi:DegV family protein with EDD domain
MPTGVAVVTDSTAYLPSEVASGIRVVPLQLDGAVAGAEGVDVRPADIVSALERRARVTTSRPSPAQLAATYADCVAGGAEAIVSVHLSGELSGTVAAAEVAAPSVSVPVRVVDSRSTAMGLGFAVLAAARAAAKGASVAEAAEVAGQVAAGTTTIFYLDSLEHLRRGGRIGAARALVGTAFSVKPILHVEAGRIVPLERVRTPSRGVARLAALAVAAAGEEPVDVAVHHLGAPDRAQRLVETLRASSLSVRELYVCEVGAVIGAHVGPGVVGVVVSRSIQLEQRAD